MHTSRTAPGDLQVPTLSSPVTIRPARADHRRPAVADLDLPHSGQRRLVRGSPHQEPFPPREPDDEAAVPDCCRGHGEASVSADAYAPDGNNSNISNCGNNTTIGTGDTVGNSGTPTADLLLHPVRWRIVHHVMGREVTTTDLKRELPEVPSTTLYRHVAALIDAGYLTVVRERRVRGATERTVTFHQTTPGVGEDEAQAMTVEQHREAMLTMLAQVAGSFDRLVERGELFSRNDQLNYRQVAIYVDQDDAAAIGERLLEVLEPYFEHAPGKDRVMLSLISVPEA
ncbi:helix-turn-helix domain-containing protein [Prauserella flavalba]|uniref:helix-turn-helix domain-containing protein n=1 Tax=Prauserella flavalba TaxID=1477506 RepID=UPI001AEFE615